MDASANRSSPGSVVTGIPDISEVSLAPDEYRAFFLRRSSSCGERGDEASPSSPNRLPNHGGAIGRLRRHKMPGPGPARVARQEPPAATRVRARAALPPPLPQDRADQRAGQPRSFEGLPDGDLLPTTRCSRPTSRRAATLWEPRHRIHLLRSRRQILPIVGRDDDRRPVCRAWHRAGGGKRGGSRRSASRLARALPGGANLVMAAAAASARAARRSRRAAAVPPTTSRPRVCSTALPISGLSCRRRMHLRGGSRRAIPVLQMTAERHVRAQLQRCDRLASPAWARRRCRVERRCRARPRLLVSHSRHEGERWGSAHVPMPTRARSWTTSSRRRAARRNAVLARRRLSREAGEALARLRRALVTLDGTGARLERRLTPPTTSSRCGELDMASDSACGGARRAAA